MSWLRGHLLNDFVNMSTERDAMMRAITNAGLYHRTMMRRVNYRRFYTGSLPRGPVEATLQSWGMGWGVLP